MGDLVNLWNVTTISVHSNDHVPLVYCGILAPAAGL
jgi:hypothetical protein